MSFRERPATCERTGFALVLVLALAVRVAAVGTWHESLTDDRDSYLALAQSLADGQGFVRPGTGEPTAYRPPVYPLVLAPLLHVGSPAASVGGLHVLLGTVTVLLTGLLAREVGLGRCSIVAAGVTAIDPLLVRYTAWPMTETLATGLVTLWVWMLFRGSGANRFARPADHVLWQCATGLVFGLTVLCRPSLWAVGLLPLAGCLAGELWQLTPGFGGRGRGRGANASRSSSPGHWRRRVGRWVPLVLSVCLCVSLWTIRNALALGAPVATTTHGGYTLLLGNNPVFYRQVVRQPWGAVWQGPSFDAWLDDLQEDAAAEADPDSEPGVSAEVAFDRLCYTRARAWIAEHPGAFLRACLLRLARFWNPAPLGPAAAGPRLLQGAVLVYYLVVLSGALVGLSVGWSRGERKLGLLLMMVLGLCLVHSVYWSNARFRAPVTPLLAVGAAAAARWVRPRIPPQDSSCNISS